MFVATHDEGRVPPEYLPRILLRVFEYTNPARLYGRQLETAASHYETQLRPPFFRALVITPNPWQQRAFDRPGHQGGEFSAVILPVISSWNFGERSSAPDLAQRGTAMHDPLIHEGALHCAATCGESLNADAYFVLNGTLL